MSLVTTALTRAFRYNSVDLVDPGATYTPEQVRDFYSAAYPEIVSAGIDGPEQKDGKLIYTFRRAVGTKGAEQISPERFQSFLSNWEHFESVDIAPDAPPVQLKEMHKAFYAGGASMLMLCMRALAPEGRSGPLNPLAEEITAFARANGLKLDA